MEKAESLTGYSPADVSGWITPSRRAYAESGPARFSRQQLIVMQHDNDSSVGIAAAYTHLGQKEKAFRAFDKALQ